MPQHAALLLVLRLATNTEVGAIKIRRSATVTVAFAVIARPKTNLGRLGFARSAVGSGKLEPVAGAEQPMEIGDEIIVHDHHGLSISSASRGRPRLATAVRRQWSLSWN